MSGGPEGEPPACRLAAGELTAEFLPTAGLLGRSLRHRGAELLGRLGDLPRALESGSTVGIPLLHPFANRLAGRAWQFEGRRVEVAPGSPWMHFDGHGLPMHGVPWPRLHWEVLAQSPCSLQARLAFRAPELLAVFPFPHDLEILAELDPGGLTIATTLIPDRGVRVPVSFGFHPYFRLPGAPRTDWRLSLPDRLRLPTDAAGIPTGERIPAAAEEAALGDRNLDEGYALAAPGTQLALEGGGLRLALEAGEGYGYAQVYAPAGQDYVALEPMTAPTNALGSGRDFPVAEAERPFRAVFRIHIEDVPPA